MSVKVRERPKGSGEWWVYIDHHGTRKAKKIGCDKRLAKEIARKIEARLLLGDTGLIDTKPDIPTFGEFATTWITTIIPNTCKVSTLHDYQKLLKTHILPAYGKTPINSINRLDIKKFIMGKVNKGLSLSRAKHIKVAMSGVFNLALDDGIIQNNPARNLGKLIAKKKTESKTGVETLTKEELALLLSTVQQHFPEYYPLMLVLARTGMRIGEAMALKWEDIDFNRRFINIQRSYSSGKYLSSPKNGKSRRVDMSLQLTETLWMLKHERAKEYGDDMPEWIFPGKTPLGVKCQYNFRKRVFEKALDIAGMRKVRIHDIRHTVASLLLNAGESLKYVKDQLGHSSIKVTVDVYGHLAPEGNKEAVDKLDEITDSPLIRNLYATTPLTPKEKGLADTSQVLDNQYGGGGRIRTTES